MVWYVWHRLVTRRRKGTNFHKGDAIDGSHAEHTTQRLLEGVNKCNAKNRDNDDRTLRTNRLRLHEILREQTKLTAAHTVRRRVRR
jgi:hypothetical protein